MEHKPASAFEEAARASGGGIVREFWDFLKHNKKWWLVPLLLIILVQAVLFLLSGSAAAPFIYPLF
jgi:hypothetical protein